MKIIKCCTALVLGVMAINANAVFTPKGMTHVSGNATGLVNVLRDYKANSTLYLDLDSIKPAKRQVLGTDPRERFLQATIKIDIAPNSTLDIDKRIDYILQDWTISCDDFSYQKVLSNAYDSQNRRLDSNRFTDDFLQKSDFVAAGNSSSTRSATTLASQVACEYYDLKQLEAQRKNRLFFWKK